VRLTSWRRVVVAAALAWGTCIAPAALATDPSDLWWNPAESGWGMQLVQGGDVAFATLYVYDAQRRPTFYTATLGASGAGYGGDLYETTGPWFGAPVFDAASVVRRKVGTLSFTPLNSIRATLQYAVDGVAVSKSIERQTLHVPDYSGRYVATVNRVTSSCGDPDLAGEHTDRYDIAITQVGTAITLDFSGPALFSCRFAGALSQSGRLGSSSAGYDCTSTENGNMAFSELTLRDGMISGRFQGHGLNNGCDHRGQFVGLVPF
jgi:hypothetical protein